MPLTLASQPGPPTLISQGSVVLAGGLLAFVSISFRVDWLTDGVVFCPRPTFPVPAKRKRAASIDAEDSRPGRCIIFPSVFRNRLTDRFYTRMFSGFAIKLARGT